MRAAAPDRLGLARHQLEHPARARDSSNATGSGWINEVLALFTATFLSVIFVARANIKAVLTRLSRQIMPPRKAALLNEAW
jgi:hypothetical protein